MDSGGPGATPAWVGSRTLDPFTINRLAVCPQYDLSDTSLDSHPMRVCFPRRRPKLGIIKAAPVRAAHNSSYAWCLPYPVPNVK